MINKLLEFLRNNLKKFWYNKIYFFVFFDNSKFIVLGDNNY